MTDTRTPRQTLSQVAAVVLASALVFGAYMGAYHILLKGGARSKAANGVLVIVPDYRLDAALVASLLVPAHEIDRLIRPTYWNPVSWVV